MYVWPCHWYKICVSCNYNVPWMYLLLGSENNLRLDKNDLLDAMTEKNIAGISDFMILITRNYMKWLSDQSSRSYHDMNIDHKSVWCIPTIVLHYSNVIMSTMASQITSPTSVYSTVYLGADQRKHQSFVSLAFVRGIPLSPVNSPYKGPVTRKMFPFLTSSWT